MAQVIDQEYDNDFNLFEVTVGDDGEYILLERVRHGQWIKITGMAPPELHGLHYCSVCNESAPRDKHFREMLSNYCPACGAKMDGERLNERI